MPFQNFMNKVRNVDNSCSRWMMRHFYILFFEFVLVIIFFVFFFNTIRFLTLPYPLAEENNLEILLFQITVNSRLLVVLLLLNSFWMLYIFNGMNRLRLLLKEIAFGLTKRPSQRPPAS